MAGQGARRRGTGGGRTILQEHELPTPPLSPEKDAKVRELHRQRIGRDKISELVGVGHSVVDRIKREMGADLPPRKPEVEDKTEASSGEKHEFAQDGWTVHLPKTRIFTLEQLVEHCKIDLSIWEVERFVANKWEVGAKDASSNLRVEPLFQVKAFLKRKVAVVAARNEIELLRKEALNYSPKFTGFKPRQPSGSGVAVELSVFDHHFGALIWGEETGGEDWDNKIAMRTWKDAYENLVHRTRGYIPEMAVIPLGNDQQNADNRAGLTENLTPQSMDSRYQKVYGISKEASRWAIDAALAEYGRVHVPIVPGNHDPLASWHLGDYLATWYRNCPGVTIDNSVPQRKWWEFGTVMLMWEHGHKGKLPDYDRIMATERPEMWGRTRWREAHTGHIHHKRVIEEKGATIRSLSSLRPACAWSQENHHSGSIRAAEAFVWSKTEGLIGQATYSILRRSENAA